MANTKTRLETLEAARMPQRGALPHVVGDDTPPEELARLRAGGREVLTYSEMLEMCVIDQKEAL